MNNKVRSLMVLKGIKQVSIARKLRVTPAAICRVLVGKSESRRIKHAIARALKMNIEDLWPKGRAA